MMKSQNLMSQHQEIVSLINKTKLSTDSNLELQGHWGKYICVLAAGFLENAISEVYSDFVIHSASPQVAEYTINTLKKIQNPKSNKFIETATKFKKEWGEQLTIFLNAENKEKYYAIDSIMNNRHKIAHGKNTSVSIVQVKKWLEDSVKVIEFIENQCAGSINKI